MATQLDWRERLTSPAVWRSLVAGLGLLTTRERRQVLLLSLVIAASKFIEMASLASVMPVIGLIVQPELLDTSDAIKWLHGMLGAPDESMFVPLLAGLAGGLILLGNLTEFMVGVLITFFKARCESRLAHDLMNDCVRAPYIWFIQRNSVSLMRMFQQEINAWGRDFLANALNLFNQVLTVVIGVAIVFGLAAMAAFIALPVIGVVLAGILLFIRPRTIRWSRRRLEASNEMMLTSGDILTGIKDFKLSANQVHLVDVFSTSYWRRSEASAHEVMWSMVPNRLLLTIGQIALLIIVVALWLAGGGSGAIASQMAVVVLITSRVIPAVSRLSASINGFWRALPWIDGILDVRRTARRAAESAGGARGARPPPRAWRTVTFADVGFRYDETREAALCDVSLVLEHGKQYGLVGPSGSGKSTLIDLLTRLLLPTRGAIRVDDVDLREVDGDAWRRQLGYVAQEPYFADDTIRANIAFGVPAAEVDEDTLLWAVRMANLDDVIRRLPEGLDTPVGERSLKFSGGQRQRLAIARAIYKRPRLLILDEATSALDRESAAGVLRAIDALKGRMTVLSISHDASMLATCDEVFTLDQGRLVGLRGAGGRSVTAASSN